MQAEVSVEVAGASMKVAEASAESGGSFHSRVENVQYLSRKLHLPWTLEASVDAYCGSVCASAMEVPTEASTDASKDLH